MGDQEGQEEILIINYLDDIEQPEKETTEEINNTTEIRTETLDENQNQKNENKLTIENVAPVLAGRKRGRKPTNPKRLLPWNEDLNFVALIRNQMLKVPSFTGHIENPVFFERNDITDGPFFKKFKWSNDNFKREVGDPKNVAAQHQLESNVGKIENNKKSKPTAPEENTVLFKPKRKRGRPPKNLQKIESKFVNMSNPCIIKTKSKIIKSGKGINTKKINKIVTVDKVLDKVTLKIPVKRGRKPKKVLQKVKKDTILKKRRSTNKAEVRNIGATDNLKPIVADNKQFKSVPNKTTKRNSKINTVENNFRKGQIKRNSDKQEQIKVSKKTLRNKLKKVCLSKMAIKVEKKRGGKSKNLQMGSNMAVIETESRKKVKGEAVNLKRNVSNKCPAIEIKKKSYTKNVKVPKADNIVKTLKKRGQKPKSVNKNINFMEECTESLESTAINKLTKDSLQQVAKATDSNKLLENSLPKSCDATKKNKQKQIFIEIEKFDPSLKRFTIKDLGKKVTDIRILGDEKKKEETVEHVDKNHSLGSEVDSVCIPSDESLKIKEKSSVQEVEVVIDLVKDSQKLPKPATKTIYSEIAQGMEKLKKNIIEVRSLLIEATNSKKGSTIDASDESLISKKNSLNQVDITAESQAATRAGIIEMSEQNFESLSLLDALIFHEACRSATVHKPQEKTFNNFQYTDQNNMVANSQNILELKKKISEVKTVKVVNQFRPQTENSKEAKISTVHHVLSRFKCVKDMVQHPEIATKQSTVVIVSDNEDGDLGITDESEKSFQVDATANIFNDTHVKIKNGQVQKLKNPIQNQKINDSELAVIIISDDEEDKREYTLKDSAGIEKNFEKKIDDAPSKLVAKWRHGKDLISNQESTLKTNILPSNKNLTVQTEKNTQDKNSTLADISPKITYHRKQKNFKKSSSNREATNPKVKLIMNYLPESEEDVTQTIQAVVQKPTYLNTVQDMDKVVLQTKQNIRTEKSVQCSFSNQEVNHDQEIKEIMNTVTFSARVNTETNSQYEVRAKNSIGVTDPFKNKAKRGRKPKTVQDGQIPEVHKNVLTQKPILLKTNIINQANNVALPDGDVSPKNNEKRGLKRKYELQIEKGDIEEPVGIKNSQKYNEEMTSQIELTNQPKSTNAVVEIPFKVKLKRGRKPKLGKKIRNEEITVQHQKNSDLEATENNMKVDNEEFLVTRPQVETKINSVHANFAEGTKGTNQDLNCINQKVKRTGNQHKEKRIFKNQKDDELKSPVKGTQPSKFIVSNVIDFIDLTIEENERPHPTNIKNLYKTHTIESDKQLIGSGKVIKKQKPVNTNKQTENLGSTKFQKHYEKVIRHNLKRPDAETTISTDKNISRPQKKIISELPSTSGESQEPAEFKSKSLKTKDDISPNAEVIGVKEVTLKAKKNLTSQENKSIDPRPNQPKTGVKLAQNRLISSQESIKEQNEKTELAKKEIQTTRSRKFKETNAQVKKSQLVDVSSEETNVIDLTIDEEKEESNPKSKANVDEPQCRIDKQSAGPETVKKTEQRGKPRPPNKHKTKTERLSKNSEENMINQKFKTVVDGAKDTSSIKRKKRGRKPKNLAHLVQNHEVKNQEFEELNNKTIEVQQKETELTYPDRVNQPPNLKTAEIKKNPLKSLNNFEVSEEMVTDKESTKSITNFQEANEAEASNTNYRLRSAELVNPSKVKVFKVIQVEIRENQEIETISEPIAKEQSSVLVPLDNETDTDGLRSKNLEETSNNKKKVSSDLKDIETEDIAQTEDEIPKYIHENNDNTLVEPLSLMKFDRIRDRIIDKTVEKRPESRHIGKTKTSVDQICKKTNIQSTMLTESNPEKSLHETMRKKVKKTTPQKILKISLKHLIHGRVPNTPKIPNTPKKKNKKYEVLRASTKERNWTGGNNDNVKPENLTPNVSGAKIFQSKSAEVSHTDNMVEVLPPSKRPRININKKTDTSDKVLKKSKYLLPTCTKEGLKTRYFKEEVKKITLEVSQSPKENKIKKTNPKAIVNQKIETSLYKTNENIFKSSDFEVILPESAQKQKNTGVVHVPKLIVEKNRVELSKQVHVENNNEKNKTVKEVAHEEQNKNNLLQGISFLQSAVKENDQTDFPTRQGDDKVFSEAIATERLDKNGGNKKVVTSMSKTTIQSCNIKDHNSFQKISEKVAVNLIPAIPQSVFYGKKNQNKFETALKSNKQDINAPSKMSLSRKNSQKILSSDSVCSVSESAGFISAFNSFEKSLQSEDQVDFRKIEANDFVNGISEIPKAVTPGCGFKESPPQFRKDNIPAIPQNVFYGKKNQNKLKISPKLKKRDFM